MKNLRNFMRDLLWWSGTSIWSIKNDILRYILIAVYTIIIVPVMILLSFIVYIPMLIKYGKNAREVDKKEQKEWLNHKLESE